MRLYKIIGSRIKNYRKKPTFTSDSRLSTSHFRLCLMALCLAALASCVRHPELINFNTANLPDNTPEQIVNAMNLTIQSEDLLRIQVHSIDDTAAMPFNLERNNQQNMQLANQAGEGGNYALELFQGYLVDQEGFIEVPTIGRIKVEGLTIEEAKKTVLDLVKPYLNDPTVNMRFLNLKITILGEVNSPGIKRLSNKRVTLLEVLGMAGDLSHYANRTNILIIREEDGRRTYKRLNLQSAEIFTSPYFYMQQNDVIYVEPIQARVATVADPAQRLITYGSAGLSLITLIIALTR